ncbi:MAG: DNA polymerase III subunit chi [Alphaproteobacteria bacterium]|nr:DNA polymerase III subunit chi [Alphaproteobacteria bacterium]
MTPVAFYQVQEATPAAVDAVLPGLLQKAYETTTVLVVAPTAARAQRLDEGLWGGLGNLGPSSFLPHGTPLKGDPTRQPILLVNLEDDPDPRGHQAHPGGLRLPVVLAGAESALPPLLATVPEKLCYLFSTTPTEVERARSLYKDYKTAGYPLQYFQQEAGRWVKK